MRTVIIVLLMLSPLAVLMPFSNPGPTTSTTFMVAETTARGSYTSTAFDTSLVSTTGTMVVDTPVNIPPKGVGFMAPRGKCSQFLLPVTVSPGVTLNLRLTSTNPANLYLLANETYQTSANGCALLGSSLLAENNFTAYTLHWTATQNDTVYLLLTGPSTILILADDGSSQAVQELATRTYASIEINLDVYSSATVVDYTTSTTVAIPAGPYYRSLQPFELSLMTLIAALGSILAVRSKKNLVTLERFRKRLLVFMPPTSRNLKDESKKLRSNRNNSRTDIRRSSALNQD